MSRSSTSIPPSGAVKGGKPSTSRKISRGSLTVPKIRSDPQIREPRRSADVSRATSVSQCTEEVLSVKDEIFTRLNPEKYFVVIGIMFGSFVAVLTIYYWQLLTLDDMVALKKIVAKQHRLAYRHDDVISQQKHVTSRQTKLRPRQSNTTPNALTLNGNVRPTTKGVEVQHTTLSPVNRSVKPRKNESKKVKNTTPSITINTTSKYVQYSGQIDCTIIGPKNSKDMCKTIEKHQVTEKHKKVYIEILQYILELAKKNKWRAFTSYGTLLGSWRHHGFIPYDADMDMYFDLKDRRDIIIAIEAQTEFVAKQVLDKEIKLYSKSKSDIDHYHKDIGRWRGPYMDLFFYTTDETHVRCATFSQSKWLKTDIFPLHDRPFGEFTVPAPRNPLRVLQILYGATSDCKIRVARKSYSCKDLDGILPFVHRKLSNRTITETLKLGSRVIHVTNVTEGMENMPESPFSLKI